MAKLSFFFALVLCASAAVQDFAYEIVTSMAYSSSFKNSSVKITMVS